MPGTPFGVVHLDVPPVTSGLAVGSLVAGIASILVSFLVICFGVAARGRLGRLGGRRVHRARRRWPAAAAVVARPARHAGRSGGPRRRPAVRFTGRGLAMAGISCGAAGLVLSLLGLGLALPGSQLA